MTYGTDSGSGRPSSDGRAQPPGRRRTAYGAAGALLVLVLVLLGL